MSTVLGLDPATRCGFAVAVDGEAVTSGVWNLKHKHDKRNGQIGLHLFQELHRIWEEYEPELCFYERVDFAVTTYAAMLHGGVKMVIQTWCEMHGIRYEGIPVATIKKFATGKGNADKAQMMAMAEKRWPEVELVDDNHADALWVLETGLRIKKLATAQTDLFALGG